MEALLAQAAQFHEDRLAVHVVLAEVPHDVAPLAALERARLQLSRRHRRRDLPIGAARRAPWCSIRLLHCVANIPLDHPNGHAAMLRNVIASLPDVDAHAGVPLFAPALIVPRVFEFAFCEHLVRFYEEMGGSDSGFLLDQAGKTQTVIDRRLKSRRDLVIVEPALREAIRERIVTPPRAGDRTLLPVPWRPAWIATW